MKKKHFNLQYCLSLLCLCSLLILTACDGESRPFTEAAEVQSQQLVSISPLPPANSLDIIYLNTGQQVQLGLQARNESGIVVSLSAADRSWYSTDPQVLTVNRNGLVTAVANGSAQAFAVIGGIASTGFEITVSNANLTGIVSIDDFSGGDLVDLERCISRNYRAIGLFDDDTQRLVEGVEWDSDTPTATIDSNSNDAISTLTATESGPLQLTASLGTATPFTAMLTVSDSLQSIDILPVGGNISIGSTRAYEAIGTYSTGTDADPEEETASTRDVSITSAVQWKITSGSNVAQVSNEAGSKGEVTGLRAGSANLQAECGTESQLVNINVVDSSTSSSDNGLSFDHSASTLRLFGLDERRLRVSTGTTYSSANDVSSQVDWSHNFPNIETAPIELPLVEGNDFLLLSPRANGQITLTAELDGASAQLLVIVDR